LTSKAPGQNSAAFSQTLISIAPTNEVQPRLNRQSSPTANNIDAGEELPKGRLYDVKNDETKDKRMQESKKVWLIYVSCCIKQQ